MSIRFGVRNGSSATSNNLPRRIGFGVLRIVLWCVAAVLVLLSAFAANPPMSTPILSEVVLLHLTAGALFGVLAWLTPWRRVVAVGIAVAFLFVLPLCLVGVWHFNKTAEFVWSLTAGAVSLSCFPPLEWAIAFIWGVVSHGESRQRGVGADLGDEARPKMRNTRAVSGGVCKSELEFRLWTAAQGGKAQEAAFIECTDGIVWVIKRDGTQGRLPLEKLSEQDREYVEQSVRAGEQDLFESI